MPRSFAASSPKVSAPVLAVLVCHNGARWLPEVLEAVQTGPVRPRHILAVDTGSTDHTALLAEPWERGRLDEVLTPPATTGCAAALLDPAAVDWTNPCLVVETGLSTDSAGRRRQVGPRRPAAESTEVLAVPSAKALVSRADWDDLGGPSHARPGCATRHGGEGAPA